MFNERGVADDMLDFIYEFLEREWGGARGGVLAWSVCLFISV